jgi:hypothetical protein
VEVFDGFGRVVEIAGGVPGLIFVVESFPLDLIL